MEEEKNVQEVQEEVQPKKRRGGRKPLSPEEKAARAKERKARKAKPETVMPDVVIQYQDIEVTAAALIETAKAEFRANKKRTQITDLKLYVKPEERAAYFVINGSFDGKIAL